MQLHSRIPLAALLLSIVAALESEVRTLPDGTVTQVAEIRGVPKWHLFPHLWSHNNVDISCPNKQEFDVYVAQSNVALYEKISTGDTAWCGIERLTSGHRRKCSISTSPFQTTFVGVVPSHDYFTGDVDCKMESSEQMSVYLILAGIVGLALFFNAEQLSQSLSFRVSTGSLIFMLLAALVLVFVLARSTPNKKSMAAAFAVFGSSISGLVRWLFGRWVPSWQQLIYNKLVWAYAFLSGLAGMAVTYYYDDEHNIKLLNILKYGLMLLGLGLVYCSTSMAEASVMLCVLLLASVPASLLWDTSPLLPSGYIAKYSDKSHIRKVVDCRRERIKDTWADGKEAGKQLLQQFQQEPALQPSTEVSPRQDAFSNKREPQPAFSQTPGSATRKQASTSGWTHPAAATPLPDEFEATTPPPPTLTARSPLPTPKPQQASDQNISPLIQRGFILNEMTGRTIKLNSATYNKLVANGHVVDKQNGVLTPPSKLEHDSDDTDHDEQPSYPPTHNTKSRLSSGRVRR